jgi:hypothetical protein
MSSDRRVSAARRSCELSIVLLLIYGLTLISAQYGETESFWEDRDDFDDMSDKIRAANEDNCGFMHVGDLKLPEDAVSHLPDIKEININPVFPNRTALLHLHNMALSRAFYFSYILQSRLVKIYGLFCNVIYFANATAM